MGAIVNRFLSEGEGWPGFPRVSYGRLDQTEPITLDDAEEAVFAFDVVSADWILLGKGERFDLTDPKRLWIEQRLRWAALSDGATTRTKDPYEEALIYRIEVTCVRGDGLFETLVAQSEEQWVRIKLSDTGEPSVDVYGGLFAEPVKAALVSIDPENERESSLSLVFDMDAWPNSTKAEIQTALGSLPALEFLVAYDVGQGSANGMMDAGENVGLYVDLGRGVYGNRNTYTGPLRFCWRRNAPIILTHWDADHWAGGANDQAALHRTWIAPRQRITTAHTTFASSILHSAGGRILIWGPSPSSVAVPVAGGTLVLAKCTGPASNKNASGISCLLDGGANKGAWLLTGDAGYNHLGQILPAHLNVIVAPHHGGDMGRKSTPPNKASTYARVIYSFGPGNKHGKTKVSHPTVAGVAAHINTGWIHAPWSPGTPGTCAAAGDTLGTSHHPATHLGGAAAGWATAPAVPFRTMPCPTQGTASMRCTGTIKQA